MPKISVVKSPEELPSCNNREGTGGGEEQISERQREKAARKEHHIKVSVAKSPKKLPSYKGPENEKEQGCDDGHQHQHKQQLTENEKSSQSRIKVSVAKSPKVHPSSKVQECGEARISGNSPQKHPKVSVSKSPKEHQEVIQEAKISGKSSHHHPMTSSRESPEKGTSNNGQEVREKRSPEKSPQKHNKVATSKSPEKSPSYKGQTVQETRISGKSSHHHPMTSSRESPEKSKTYYGHNGGFEEGPLTRNSPPKYPKVPIGKSYEKYSSYDDRQYDEGRYYEKSQHDPKSQERKDNGRCCSLPKLLAILVLLGGGFGITFAVVGLDTIKGWFGGGTEDVTTITPVGNDTVSEYQFMQCPEEGACCNGLESNCDLRVNELLYATVHNANHDSLLVNNHEAPFEGSLDRGYRGLMIDVCKCNDGNGNMQIEFCHTYCGIGPRDPTEVFHNVNKFLDDNPTEFIVFNFEMSTSEDDEPPSQADLWELIQPIEGFRKKTYDHSGGQWPTARELIETNKRIILFQHNGYYLCPTGNEANCAPRIENYFDHVVESDWRYNDVQALSDTSKSCVGTRGVLGKKEFYSLNNFVTTQMGPSKASADVINEKDFILQRLEDCKKETGMGANFVNIDFWQRGDTPEVAQIVNAERAARWRRRL